MHDLMTVVALVVVLVGSPPSMAHDEIGTTKGRFTVDPALLHPVDDPLVAFQALLTSPTQWATPLGTLHLFGGTISKPPILQCGRAIGYIRLADGTPATVAFQEILEDGAIYVRFRDTVRGFKATMEFRDDACSFDGVWYHQFSGQKQAFRGTRLDRPGIFPAPKPTGPRAAEIEACDWTDIYEAMSGL